MKKVISNTKEISLDELVDRLQRFEKLTIVYIARSELPYYTFFSSTSHGEYGFKHHTSLDIKMTYRSRTIRGSLQAAIKGGKELLVFERNEMDQLFKL